MFCIYLQHPYGNNALNSCTAATSQLPSRIARLQLFCRFSFSFKILPHRLVSKFQARFNSADLNIAYRMDVDEYQKLCPYAESLEENWGKPPGVPPDWIPT